MSRSHIAPSLLAVLAAFFAGQPQEALSAEPGATRAAQGQFGDYVWTDIDGNPLPFQNDAGLVNFLQSAEVTEKTMVDEGISMPRRLVLTENGVSAHALFKDIDLERNKVTERTAGRSHFYLDWRDSYIYENAAMIVDRMLEINRVPPAVLRRYGNSPGTMIMWIEGTITEEERQKRGLVPPDRRAWLKQLQIMHIFNNLIAKRDLNLGNILIDDGWRVWFIDSSRSFGTVRDLLYPESILFCDPELWDRLRALDPERVQEELKPFLSKSEIKALLARRDKIVQHLLDLIEQHGEDRVIFDIMDENTASQQGRESAG